MNKSNKFSYRLLVILPMLLLGFISLGDAKTYKYQDEQGRWHFTDRPPEGLVNAQELQIGKAQEPDVDNTPLTRDLAALLYSKYTSKKPEHIASLAVVEIKNTLGHGSGFFFSNDGYIITNKHVVRPTKTKRWQKAQEGLAAQEQRFLATENNLNRHSAYHDKIYNSLLEYESAISQYRNSSSRRVLEAEYRIIENNFYESKRQLDILQVNYDTAKEQFEDSKSKLFWKERDASFATQFKIRIKDGSNFTADLVAVSKHHDLALLKINGYTTPYLTAGTLNNNLQGAKVFIIGSPLGVSDSLTSGTVTRTEPERIFTDSHILPGNSGGPLINVSGKILGVVTQKLYIGNIATQGFGVAIPINILSSEFEVMRSQGF